MTSAHCLALRTAPFQCLGTPDWENPQSSPPSNYRPTAAVQDMAAWHTATRRWHSAVAVVVAGIVALSLVPTSSANPLVECSRWNTATTAANYSIFQTNGLCHDFCFGKHAWAIVNYQSCWCSDYTPDGSTIVAPGMCNTPCPGYPSEFCGGASNLFGYIALAMAPMGTRGPSSPPLANSHTTARTGADTATLAGSTPASPTSSSLTSATSTSVVSTLVPLIETVTENGVQHTVTVTPTVMSTGSLAVQVSGKGSAELASGQIAGLVVGVVVAVVVLGGVATAVVSRLRKKWSGGVGEAGSRNSFASPADGGVAGVGMADASGRGPAMTRAGVAGGPSSEREVKSRSQRLSQLEVDPRMDSSKGGLSEGNQSRESINTLRDDRDYSRRVHQPRILRAINPDPDPGEE